MNKQLLRGILRQNKVRQSDLANILELSENSVSHKINENGSEFTRSEILKIKTRFELSDREVVAIFFED